MAWCEHDGMDYVFGLAQNDRFRKQIEPQMAQAEQQYQETKANTRVFTEFFYATRDTWSREGRVIAKAEHLDKESTHVSWSPRCPSEPWRRRSCMGSTIAPRGDYPQNRIKEQQLDLFADRTSTSKMWSNQLPMSCCRLCGGRR
jgi:hypothetical protein